MSVNETPVCLTHSPCGTVYYALQDVSKSVDKTQVRDHSNESYEAVILSVVMLYKAFELVNLWIKSSACVIIQNEGGEVVLSSGTVNYALQDRRSHFVSAG